LRLKLAVMARRKEQAGKTGALIGDWTMAEFQNEVNNVFPG
jgi:hypothetical protein